MDLPPPCASILLVSFIADSVCSYKGLQIKFFFFSYKGYWNKKRRILGDDWRRGELIGFLDVGSERARLWSKLPWRSTCSAAWNTFLEYLLTNVLFLNLCIIMNADP